MISLRKPKEYIMAFYQITYNKKYDFASPVVEGCEIVLFVVGNLVKCHDGLLGFS